MNKQLALELYEQARTAAGEQSGFNTTNIDVAEHLIRLVVQECAKEILSWKSEPFPYDPGFGAMIIKKHFGIDK